MQPIKAHVYITTSLVVITSCTNIGTSSYVLSPSVFFTPHRTSARLLDLGLILREEFGLLVLLGITVRTQQWQDRDFHEHSVKTDYTSLGLLGLLLPRREGACKYDASVKIRVNTPAFCAETRPPFLRLSMVLITNKRLYGRTSFSTTESHFLMSL